MTDQVIRIVLQGDGAQLSTAANRGVSDLQRLGAAGEQAGQRVARGSQAAVLSMRQISPQLTDIATSLASGQSPFLVLLQQGGQLKDMAGGMGPLWASLSAAISPAAVGLGAVAAALGLVYTASAQARSEDTALRNSLALTGNAAGITADGFTAISREVARASGGTVSASRDIVKALVDTGQIGGGAMGVLGTAIARVAEVTGKTGAEVAADFAGMSKGVGDWAVKHNESWHFATAAQVDYIRQLEDTGQQQRAMIEVGNLLNQHLQGQQAQVGALEGAWRNLTAGMAASWETMKAIGREKTPLERLQAATLARSMALGPGGRVNDQQAYNAAQRDIDNANRDLLRSQERASMASLTAIEQADRIAANEKARRDAAAAARRGSTRTTDPEAEYRRSVADILRNRAPRLAEIEASGYGAATAAGNANEAASLAALRKLDEERARLADRASATAADYAAQLQQQTAQLNASLITDDQQRAAAQLEIERQAYQSRIDELAAYGADVRSAQDGLAAWVVARQAQMVDQLKPQWQRMLEGWGDTTKVMQSGWDAAISNMLDGASQQFGRWASGQGGSLKGVLQSFVAEIAQAQFKAVVGSLFKDSGSSWAAALAQLFKPNALGGVYASPGLHAYANRVVDKPTVFPFAKGIGLMGEAGPEAIMPLRRGPGGRLGVEMSGGAGAITIISRPVIQIDARSDQAQVAQLVSNGVNAGNEALIKALKARGVLK